MATVKPSKPSVTLPDNFGGVKTEYTPDQISNGYLNNVPQTVDGGNINYEKDGIFRFIKYFKTVIDMLVDTPAGKTIVVNSSNSFDYITPENAANKTGTINSSSTAAQYPTAKAVYDAIKDINPALFQLKSNLVQSLSQATDKYPSAKAVQDAVNSKQATITGGASTIVSSNLTANRALMSNSSGKVAVSAVTSTELGYLDGVTSNVQNQLNDRAKLSGNNTYTGTNTFQGSDKIIVNNAFSGGATIYAKANDTNGKGQAALHGYYTGGGDFYNRLYVKNTTANKDAYIDVVLNDNGTVRYQFGGGSLYNLPTSSNSQQAIPHTKFVHDVVDEAFANVFSAGHIGQTGYTSRTDVPEGCAWCDGSEYTQSAYPNVYNLLVNNKLRKTTYSDFNSKVSANGFCDYFALDTTNKKFKVPKLLDKFVMDVDSSVPVKGNGKTLGLTNGTSLTGFGTNTAGTAYINTSNYGQNTRSTSYAVTCENGAWGITKDSSKSGIIADTTSAKSTAVLKAYVVLYATAVPASTAQASEFMTALGGKANTDLSNISSNIDYVTESGSNYMKFKSKKLICWGEATASGTISLPKPFANTSYRITLGLTVKIDSYTGTVTGKTTTSFTYYAIDNRDSDWIAIGQGA